MRTRYIGEITRPPQAQTLENIWFTMSFIKHYKNSKIQFGWIIILLHWFLAIAIIGLFALGLYMMELSYYDSFYTLAPQIHEAIGILVAALMAFRLVWKAVNVSPEPAASNSRFVNRASNAAHNLMYLLIFVVLIAGLLISFAGGAGIKIFDWFVIPGPAEFFNNQATTAGEIHLLVAYALMALVTLHTLAAFKHHIIDKDNTLNNILGIEEKK